MATVEKHSPGPWRIERDGRDFHGERYLRDSSGNALMCDMKYYPWTPDSDADWNLIAAAPDMLEALEAIQKVCEDVAEGRGENNIGFIRALEARAYGAIRKANGL